MSITNFETIVIDHLATVSGGTIRPGTVEPTPSEPTSTALTPDTNQCADGLCGTPNGGCGVPQILASLKQRVGEAGQRAMDRLGGKRPQTWAGQGMPEM